ncbi:MAG: ribbon-helix-helix protein, CopG family [Chloroflexi bacterium]|nr:ribbon-helix-helix protein, CopG family [Chloroflexota bacterium]
MTKRLQVLFDDDELAEIQRLARRQRKTTAEWVRDALRAARTRETYPDAEPKLRAVREALSYAYPAGDIEDLLGDIEHGYAGRPDGE